jgi:hypothetical protein
MGKNKMKKSQFKQLIKEEILKELKENLSSKEEEALENLFSFYIDQNYIAIDGNNIKTDKFEDIFKTSIEDLKIQKYYPQTGNRDCSTGNCSFNMDYEDGEEYMNFLLSIKNKLITHLIDNIGNKIEVSILDTPTYYYSPFVKNNTIYINFIPLNYSEETNTKFINPEETKINWHPLEINGYKFYAYKNYNPKVKLGKGKNVAEFQTVKIPGDDVTTYSLATLPNFKTGKISKNTLQRRLILINYLKSNNIPFLIDTRDSGRSYIQVPITYLNEYLHK